MSLNIPLLKEICETPGAPGHEYRIRRVVRREVADLVDRHETDAMGNLITFKKRAFR